MSEFIITPSNIDLLKSLFRDPLTGRWTIPVLTFNTQYGSPYYNETDYLNEDPYYQKSIIDHFYIRLKEKWLRKDPEFRRLVKYFKVEQDGNKGTVSMVTNLDNLKETVTDKKYRDYIYKYIEKYFITKHLIAKIIRRYVAVTHINWYDLLQNTDTIKELIAHKLKKLIIATVYKLQDKEAQTTA